MMKTDDINDQAITKDKIRDGNVTTEKLADGAVSTDKLPDGAIKASKIADENITTEKLAEGAVETSKIADQNVTSEKIADQSVDNSKLSPEAVTYDKVKDKAIITEKLNDRAVTTEKVEERAITNPKLGNQSVDGRVVREASLETKHFANGSVTTEKIKDSSVTNEKVADDTLGIEKFDPELRKTIQAATGLPGDLSQMIQDVDKSVKQLREKDTDLQSQVNDNQKKITANKSAQDTKNASLDENMAKLNTRDDQITETLKNITVTGGASVASAVTYDNTTSQLTSVNIQGAVDELQGAKIDKTSILQESGEAEDKVMSQKAVSAKLSDIADNTEIRDTENNIIKNPFSYVNTSEFMNIETDADDNVLACTYADGSHYAHNMKSETIDELSSNFSEKIEKLKEIITGSNVVLRNEQNTDALFSACRYNTLEAQGKDLQLCIVTDSHGETTPVYNAVKLTSNFASIDAIIHCGDICTYIYDSGEVQSVIKVMSSCVKPWFIVVGNHDVGNTLYLNAAATHDEIFMNFILPMIESGILKEGEYTYGKNYYYHDFKESKIRLIVPYEYDNPLDVADNDYWNVVEYDSTAAMVKPGSSYSVGDKINCAGYKEHSFVCKKNVVTIDNTQNADYTLHTLPYYKCGRAARVIMEEQARWFIDTLNSTPEGYGIVVATHNPAMINSSNVKDYKFAVSSDLNAKDDGMYAMETDLFSELINGFNNKTTGNIKVKMCHSGWHTADASYLNVNGDSDKYAYSLDYDFTNVKANFIAYIGGHSHRDLVFKHNSYDSQYSINPVCASNNKQQRHAADIPNVNDVNSLAFDALTVVTFRKNSLILNRLGNQWSTEGKHRNFELIKIK